MYGGEDRGERGGLGEGRGPDKESKIADREENKQK